jgi:hypothetical protein
MVSQKFEPRVAEAVINAFLAGVPVVGDALQIELEEREYLHETPRLARGNVLDAGDREVAVLLRLEQPMLAVLGGVLSDEVGDDQVDADAAVCGGVRPRSRAIYRELGSRGVRSNCAKPL